VVTAPIGMADSAITEIEGAHVRHRSAFTTANINWSAGGRLKRG
jgi:hypothetical protein